MFKDVFKYYKSRNPPPDLKKVFDFDRIDDRFMSKVKMVNIKDIDDLNKYGLRSLKTWEAYELVDHPGLIFIKNPFTNLGHRYWTVRCVQDYTKRPNKTNLDPFKLVPEGKEWWDVCQNNNDRILMSKLRWVTLGYHHDWDSKIYSEESKGEFPKDLADLSRHIAQALDLSFNAEAAIVNFYHMDSTLSGHTDNSEQSLEAPLLSFSFGQTAIFLLGGQTKDEKPSAMFIRSGDTIVMTKESRLCYHGVPKILQIDSRLWSSCYLDCLINKEFREVVNICKEEALWQPFSDYLKDSRININVRQVLKRGQKRLSTEPNEQK